MKKVAKLAQRYFEGLPLKDATSDILIRVTAKDIDAAKGHEKDENNCILAQACKNSLGSEKVVFYHRYAYVDHEDEHGIRTAHRYEVKNEALEILEKYDRKELSFNFDKTVRLHKPSPSQRLDSKADQRIKREASAGKYVRPAKPTGRKLRNPVVLDVRSGTGQVRGKIKRISTV